MERYKGGEQVPGGFYWSPKGWSFTAVSGEHGKLEGAPEDRFIKLPLPLMVVLATAVSFGFVVFLPAIGFVLFAWVVAQAVVNATRRVLGTAAAAVAPVGWQPGEAHLTGSPGSEGAPATDDEPLVAPPEGELEALRRDIEERRRDEEW